MSPAVAATAITDPSPAACGSCHERELAEWRDSAHAHSAGSPVLRALLPEVEAAWGEDARARCVSCHEPRLEADANVGCVTCHAAIGNLGTHDGRLRWDLSLPVAGSGGGGDAPHPVRDGAFLRSADLCGTCHEITGPRLFVEPTHSEFLASPAAAAGLTCQSCHMRRGADGHTDHRFIGASPAFAASAEARADRAAASVALLRDALRLELTRLPSGRVAVSLRNVGAGHNVPTGATLLRSLWVEVEVDGVRSRALTLGATLEDRFGAVVLPTEAERATVMALAPGEAVSAELDAPGPVAATLYASAVERELAAALGVEEQVPTWVVVTATNP